MFYLKELMMEEKLIKYGDFALIFVLNVQNLETCKNMDVPLAFLNII